MTAQEIQAALNGCAFEYIGLRVDDGASYQPGDVLPSSHQLLQDQDYDDDGEPIYKRGVGIYADFFDLGELSGTSAIRIDPDDSGSIQAAIDRIKIYYGHRAHLIGGNSAESGQDVGEIIIADAVCIAYFDI